MKISKVALAILPVGICAILFQNFSQPKFAESSSVATDEIYDFLIPDVCLDADGKQTLQNPLNSSKGQPACDKTRQMAAGDFFPYYRTDFLPINDRFFSAVDPSSNPSNPRVFIFPVERKYDATDQTGLRSTMIVQWQSRPINKAGDADRFAELHPQDTLGALTVRKGYGSLLGGLKMPRNADENIQYNLSTGLGMYNYKKANSAQDKGYDNAGVALFELAWSFPQVKTDKGYRAPVFGETLYEVLPKRTWALETAADGSPIFDLNKAEIPKAASIGMLSNVGRFRYGPGEGFSKVPGVRVNNYMETLVHYGFVKSNLAQDGPGRANSEDVDINGNVITNNPGVSEHTYLTRELGYNTRWELWRGTNLVRKNWDENEVAATKAYERQNCTVPANIGAGGKIITMEAFDDNEKGSPIVKNQRARKISEHFAVSNVLVVNSKLESVVGKPYYLQYYYSLDSANKWHRLRWVMVGCHDSSNVKSTYENNFINSQGEKVISSKDNVVIYPHKVKGVVMPEFLNLFQAQVK